jgi:FixJ family two-component response regulator
MRAGAVHFLPKPFSDADILAAVSEALDRSAQRLRDRRARAAVDRAYATLTPREREVFALVAQGELNKVIAARLGAAEKTVKIHRARVMSKMGAKSIADLVRMASLLAS